MYKRQGQKLGAFPTTFLVKSLNKAGVLEAIKNGRMYFSRGDGAVWPTLEGFLVSGEGNKRAFMGETLTTARFPVIRARIAFNTDKEAPVTIRLIRGGTLIQTFTGTTPLEVEFTDREAPPGALTYYLSLIHI